MNIAVIDYLPIVTQYLADDGKFKMNDNRASVNIEVEVCLIVAKEFASFVIPQAINNILLLNHYGAFYNILRVMFPKL